jgi:hypothetical protein
MANILPNSDEDVVEDHYNRTNKMHYLLSVQLLYIFPALIYSSPGGTVGLYTFFFVHIMSDDC